MASMPSRSACPGSKARGGRPRPRWKPCSATASQGSPRQSMAIPPIPRTISLSTMPSKASSARHRPKAPRTPFSTSPPGSARPSPGRSRSFAPSCRKSRWSLPELSLPGGGLAASIRRAPKPRSATNGWCVLPRACADTWMRCAARRMLEEPKAGPRRDRRTAGRPLSLDGAPPACFARLTRFVQAKAVCRITRLSDPPLEIRTDARC